MISEWIERGRWVIRGTAVYLRARCRAVPAWVTVLAISGAVGAVSAVVAVAGYRAYLNREPRPQIYVGQAREKEESKATQ